MLNLRCYTYVYTFQRANLLPYHGGAMLPKRTQPQMALLAVGELQTIIY